MQLSRTDILKHEFQQGIYTWKAHNVENRAFVRFSGKILRISAEIRVTSGWKPNNGIIEFKDLYSRLLKTLWLRYRVKQMKVKDKTLKGVERYITCCILGFSGISTIQSMINHNPFDAMVCFSVFLIFFGVGRK